MDSSRGNFARVDALANGDFDVNVWGEENGDLEMLFRNLKVYNRSPFPEGKKSN